MKRYDPITQPWEAEQPSLAWRQRRALTVIGALACAVLIFLAGMGASVALITQRMGDMQQVLTSGMTAGRLGQGGAGALGQGGQGGGGGLGSLQGPPGQSQDGSGSGSGAGQGSSDNKWAAQQGLPAGLPPQVIGMLRQQFPNGIPDDIKQQIQQQFGTGGG